MGLGALFLLPILRRTNNEKLISNRLNSLWRLAGLGLGRLGRLFIRADYLCGYRLPDRRHVGHTGKTPEKRLSSEVGARGIFKKVLIFAMVAVGHIIDAQVITNGSAVRTAVIFFYLSNEGISILENAAKIGLPIPEKLKLVLDQLNKEETING